jgi:poly-beta-1,6-N-acetyl-D-glucosamine synthase
MTGYAVITPARNEESDLPRLAESLIAQTLRPETWVIVDHGSDDGTAALAERLAGELPWVVVLTLKGEPTPTRGGPIVEAFTAGLERLGSLPEIAVKLDADVTFDRDHFARLTGAFEADPRLGIASGTCWELEAGEWRAKLNARSHVRGAVRAYRRECLDDVLPLELRFGWDTIDEIKAQLHGWHTRSIADLAFYHHRATGARDGGRKTWRSQGDLAWYLGYRFPYLFFRTMFRSVEDRHALGMLAAWSEAAIRRDPRYPDADVRRFLRDQQSIIHLSRRAGEVLHRGR